MISNYQNGHQPNGHAGLSRVQSNVEEEWTAEALAEIWARRAAALAEPPPAEIQGQRLNLLTFVLGNERYAVDVSHVREIYPLEQVTAVPRTPAFVVGVFSARGRLISVVDLHAFFGLPRLSIGPSSKVIVVAAAGPAGVEVGLLADDVTGLLTVYQDELETAITAQAEYMRGIAAGMVGVLNLDILLNSKPFIVQEEIA
jgi:purine-binding chemotaxis protein CheW